MPFDQPDPCLGENADLRPVPVGRVRGLLQLDGADNVESLVTHQVVDDHLLSPGPRRIFVGPLADPGVEEATEADLWENVMLRKRRAQRLVKGLLRFGQGAPGEKLRLRGRLLLYPKSEHVGEHENADDNKYG